MSHRSVVTLLQDAAESLSDAIQFGYGRRSDYNLTEKKKNIMVWLLPLTATPAYTVNNTENYQKTWNCAVFFFQLTPSDTTEKEFTPVLHDLDELVDQFVNRVNDWSMKSADTVGAVTLQNFQQYSVIKENADISTGWLLQFQMTTSDDFHYCTPENVRLYANS